MSAMEITTCPRCDRKNRVPAAAQGRPQCGNCGAPLPWVTEADDGTFADIAERTNLFVLVDLWAPWCGPCRMVSPALEQLAHELAGRLKLVKVNVDESPAVAQRFDARAIPTLLVLHHGTVLARQAGAAPLAVLRNWTQSAIDTAHPSES
jgi:thioredoxin 2